MPTEIPFDHWLKLIFDHEIDERQAEWYFQPDAETEPVDPATYVKYTTTLFRNSAELLRPYSDIQKYQGLNVLISNCASNNILALLDNAIPLEDRLAFINAIFDLNQQTFETRCTPHLSHLDRHSTPPEVSPLNMICYMWWDTFVSPGGALNEACLWVMEKALHLANPAVLEGALHGIGHWRSEYPRRCETMIAEFLDRRGRELSPELRVYAQAAQTGCIQ
jgi:hypothetical protein